LSSDGQLFPKIKVSKLDAARRQLETAINLWFSGGDTVSIHALSHAAYEIIHVVSKKRQRSTELLFDSPLIKDVYRRQWAELLKSPGNFFKHADRDPEGAIEFAPELSKYFMIFSILGLELAGERISVTENGFLTWLKLHEPDFLTEEGRKVFAQKVPVEIVEGVRRIPKNEFLKIWVQAAASRGFS
jgi:hypothetical protein